MARGMADAFVDIVGYFAVHLELVGSRSRACERDGYGTDHELRKRPLAQSDPAQGSQRLQAGERRQIVREERTPGALHASTETVHAAAWANETAMRAGLVTGMPNRPRAQE